MKILIVVRHSPKHRFLVTLNTKKLVGEVKNLIGKKRHSQAIVTALSKGRFEREVAHHEIPAIATDLILSEDSASWSISR